MVLDGLMLKTALSHLLYYIGDTVFDLYEQTDDRHDMLYKIYNWSMQKSFALDVHEQVWKLEEWEEDV